MTDDSTNESGGLIVPAVKPLYDAIAPYGDILLRLVLGLGFVAHGWGKMFDPAGFAQFLAGEGFASPEIMAWLIILTEVAGGIMVAIGLFIRPAAFAMVVFMIVAISHKWGAGFFGYAGGYELDLAYLVIALKFFAQGAGRYSVDERLGKTF